MTTIVRDEDKNGYAFVRVTGHPFLPDGGYYLHRFIMSEILGRRLLWSEHVHHKDRNRHNNHPSNLKVMWYWDHLRLHGRQKVFGPAYRAKLRAAAQKRWNAKTDEEKFAFSSAGGKALRGHVMPDWHRDKISEAHAGKVLSAEHKANVGKAKAADADNTERLRLMARSAALKRWGKL